MKVATPYTFATRVAGSPFAVRPRVEAALREVGFGTVTQIDAAAAATEARRPLVRVFAAVGGAG